MKKKNKNLIAYNIGIIVIAGIITLVVISKDDNSDSSAYSASALAASESSFDFNTISMNDGDVSHKFELRNEGDEAVKIEKVYTSCMCTVASIIDSSGKKRGRFGMPGHGLPSKTNITVESGDYVIAEAIFDPTAHGPSGVGLAQRSIYIETNSQRSPKIELKFNATVTR